MVDPKTDSVDKPQSDEQPGLFSLAWNYVTSIDWVDTLTSFDWGSLKNVDTWKGYIGTAIDFLPSFKDVISSIPYVGQYVAPLVDKLAQSKDSLVEKLAPWVAGQATEALAKLPIDITGGSTGATPDPAKLPVKAQIEGNIGAITEMTEGVLKGHVDVSNSEKLVTHKTALEALQKKVVAGTALSDAENASLQTMTTEISGFKAAAGTKKAQADGASAPLVNNTAATTGNSLSTTFSVTNGSPLFTLPVTTGSPSVAPLAPVFQFNSAPIQNFVTPMSPFSSAFKNSVLPETQTPSFTFGNNTQPFGFTGGFRLK